MWEDDDDDEENNENDDDDDDEDDDNDDADGSEMDVDWSGTARSILTYGGPNTATTTTRTSSVNSPGVQQRQKFNAPPQPKRRLRRFTEETYKSGDGDDKNDDDDNDDDDNNAVRNTAAAVPQKISNRESSSSAKKSTVVINLVSNSSSDNDDRDLNNGGYNDNDDDDDDDDGMNFSSPRAVLAKRKREENTIAPNNRVYYGDDDDDDDDNNETSQIGFSRGARTISQSEDAIYTNMIKTAIEEIAVAASPDLSILNSTSSTSITRTSGENETSADAVDNSAADSAPNAPSAQRDVFDEMVKQAEVDVEHLPTTKQPPELVTQLKPFQLQGLEWLWPSKLGHVDFQDLDENGSHAFKEDYRAGAILADDMGLGKSIQAIALIARLQSIQTSLFLDDLLRTARIEYEETGQLPPYTELTEKTHQVKLSYNKFFPEAVRNHPFRRTTPSLIVCPTSLVGNWLAETREHSPVLIRAKEASTTASITAQLICSVSIFIVSYKQLSFAYQKHKETGNHPLFTQNWNVIVLDEAHSIRSAKATKTACLALGSSKFRLCLTGTPIHNTLADLYPLFEFIKVPQYLIGTLANWKKRYVTAKTINNLDRVNLVDLLQKYMLRRMKTQTILGKPIVTLPKIHQQMVKLPMPQVQARIYRVLQLYLIKTVASAETRAARAGNQLIYYSAAFTAAVRLLCTAEHAAASIFGLCGRSWEKTRDVLKLARYAEHDRVGQKLFEDKVATIVEVYAVKKQAEKAEKERKKREKERSMVVSLNNGVGENPVAGDTQEDNAANQATNDQNVEAEEIHEIAAENDAVANSVLPDSKEDQIIFFDSTSSKFDALMVALEPVLTKTQEKVVIFSNYVTTLLLLQRLLRFRFPKYKVTMLTGKDKSKDRSLIIANFQGNPAVRIFLVSMMAGGVGLTLTAANHVYILSMWHNWTVHQQAIDRVHRISQTKPVTAINFYCGNTIDVTVAARQQVKRAIAREALRDETGFNVNDPEVLALINPNGQSLKGAQQPTEKNGVSKLRAEDFVQMVQYIQ